jgi:hypothetical protein
MDDLQVAVLYQLQAQRIMNIKHGFLFGVSSYLELIKTLQETLYR